MRTIVFWGLYWGPLILGNYQMATSRRLKPHVKNNGSIWAQATILLPLVDAQVIIMLRA